MKPDPLTEFNSYYPFDLEEVRKIFHKAFGEMTVRVKDQQEVEDILGFLCDEMSDGVRTASRRALHRLMKLEKKGEQILT